ncbi:thiamine ABC transporter ATP-binding protein [Pseudoprimorskyibacter insulae]|uniref:Thiamine import ATP-binding protein ThiQ n=1 Tax=Pseudoprimorskyibacter insulae TaxID=1695997 RepID=A0A2R8AUW1_9RHOB|nr:ATP-binding cassette domain-containing protein [Pseudoprimorskyibacter insulae]SPF79813.1 Thiamine import ATP-binding protein ThiQ [Pseudoprimorskyibacter insulae]
MLIFDKLTYDTGGFALSADFSVQTGDRVAIIGPSGAGKSTLLDLIAGFRAPTTGHILWNGTDITAHAPGARPVALLFQDNNLFPHLTLRQNLSLALRPDGRHLTADQRRALIDALAQVGLAGYEDRKPGTLSGGQQSRAGLARALLQDRPCLLLDEPFSALGPAMRAEMQDLVIDLATRVAATALLVTHDPAEAERFATKAIVVADGVASPPENIKTLMQNPPKALTDYLGSK